MSNIERQLPYYTYLLCYPNNIPFYIGKGFGKRMLKHEKDAIKKDKFRKSGYNELKENVILDILSAGLEIKYIVVARYAEEYMAFQTESILISQFGPSQLLTNIACNRYGWDAEKHRKCLNGSYVETIQTGETKQEWDISKFRIGQTVQPWD